MQPGDIVELSAYGKKLKCNHSFVGRVGLVVEVDSVAGLVSHANAVMVTWGGDDPHKPCYHIRADLKHAK
jgi:hypothetical protein